MKIQSKITDISSLFAGAFKRCSCCGMVFDSKEEFLSVVKYLGPMRELHLFNCLCNTTLAIKASQLGPVAHDIGAVPRAKGILQQKSASESDKKDKEV